ncbi:MAG: hypothetical protein COB04_15640 [Gammaproteobacteria bacterium]|nr:MAG: hypothetical protein COB04_15640 [Gammaproteobacteria bacterium]
MNQITGWSVMDDVNSAPSRQWVKAVLWAGMPPYFLSPFFLVLSFVFSINKYAFICVLLMVLFFPFLIPDS